MPYITLGQAAKAFDISKSMLSRAIKEAKISVAERLPDGSYRLDPAEVERFRNTMRPHVKNTSEPLQKTSETPSVAVEMAKLETELSGLKALLEAERHRAERAEQDRDDWKEQAKRQTLLLEHAAKAPPVTRGGLFGWLGGRRAANG